MSPPQLLARVVAAPKVDYDWVVLYRVIRGEPVTITDVRDLRAVLRLAHAEQWTRRRLSKVLQLPIVLATKLYDTDPADVLEVPVPGRWPKKDAE